MPEWSCDTHVEGCDCIPGHTAEPFWTCYRGECSDHDCYEGECCVECTEATSKWGTLSDAKEVIWWPCEAVKQRNSRDATGGGNE